jgi:predicted HNH restriction endonuclease
MPSGCYQHKKGRKISDATRLRMRKPHKRFSEEAKERMSESRKGDKHWNWKGGITKDYRHRTGDKKYRDWRTSVFIRDRFTCQNCKKVGTYIVAHHIKPWSQYKELRYTVDNGITLCEDCHRLVHNWKPKQTYGA